jgi:ABC-type multidrug transport system ATPase subunit
MDLINKLAGRNRTIICTIHQPRSNIYQLFDKLLLLAHGETVFFGHSKDSISYFANLGYPCPKVLLFFKNNN